MQIIVHYHIKEQRWRHNRMSIRQLETLSGVSKAHISDIENGKHDLTVKALCALAEAFKVPPSELFSYEKIDN